jgi:formylglycine-generating enzyme required for sulfatase activity
VTGDYWNYPTSTDAVPYSDQPPGSDAPDPSNTANAFKNDGIANGYDDGYALSGSNSYSYWSNVGSYPLSSSPYGTFDQGGNLWEYNETHNGSGSTWMRGGSWGDSMLHLAASDRNMTGFMNQGGSIGFRVATIAVPEPGILAVAVLAIATIAWRRRVL